MTNHQNPPRLPPLPIQFPLTQHTARGYVQHAPCVRRACVRSCVHAYTDKRTFYMHTRTCIVVSAAPTTSSPTTNVPLCDTSRRCGKASFPVVDVARRCRSGVHAYLRGFRVTGLGIFLFCVWIIPRHGYVSWLVRGVDAGSLRRGCAGGVVGEG